MKKIKIAVDAMGGDDSPKVNIEGSILALKQNENIEIVLVGKEDLIKKELEKFEYDKKKLTIINATEIITNDDSPTLGFRRKKDSSISVGLNLLKDNICSGFVSAGNTGALLTASTFIVGRIKGIERPALGVLLPNSRGFSFLIDSGANTDCKPKYLSQFAKMGTVYMEAIMNINLPKVGLINIGSEEEKGNILVKESYELLKNDNSINFIGNIEAREIPFGESDVLVCDGFVGNTILKYTEGFSKMLLGKIKEEMMSKTIYKIGAVLSSGAFKELKKSFNYEEQGGAPFIGLNSLVVKAHGNSSSLAIKGAINQCYLGAVNNLVDKLAEKL